MKSFKQYLFESAAGNYVSVKVDTPIIIKSLEPLFGGNHVCEPADQHVTLIYSKGTDVPESKILDTLHHYDAPIEAVMDSVAAFDAIPKAGQRDEDLCTIVVKLKSDILNEIHERLKKERGLNHSYPEYSPHVSLLYNLPRSEKKHAIDVIEEFIKEGKQIVKLRGFVVNPIIEDWHKKIK